MRPEPEYLRHLYEDTRIIRQPTFGIHAGYHDLPYILVGKAVEAGYRSTEIRGKVLVSPKLIVRPGEAGPAYGEVFDPETIPETIVGRLFAFKFDRRPVSLELEDFSRRHLEYPVSDAVNRVLDELERREVINTGVILAPDVEYYPVSLDKFITSILDQEFA